MNYTSGILGHLVFVGLRSNELTLPSCGEDVNCNISVYVQKKSFLSWLFVCFLFFKDYLSSTAAQVLTFFSVVSSNTVEKYFFYKKNLSKKYKYS